MYVQTHQMTARGPVPIETAETPALVRLLEQTADHKVVYSVDDGETTATCPSHEFFSCHREATREEIDGAPVLRTRGGK